MGRWLGWVINHPIAHAIPMGLSQAFFPFSAFAASRPSSISRLAVQMERFAYPIHSIPISLIQRRCGESMRAGSKLAGAKLGRTTGFSAVLVDHRSVSQKIPPKLLGQSRKLDPLIPLLPAFGGPRRGRLPMSLGGALKDNPVPLACWECGKALVGRRNRFCSNECARAPSPSTTQQQLGRSSHVKTVPSRRSPAVTCWTGRG
jgi:hypothetical protein